MNLYTAIRQSKFRAVALLTILLFCAAALHTRSAGAAMAPANSVIGNQASATYVDNTATTRTSTSNTVQTTVAQVKSFTLTQTGAKSASANQQVCYPHTITNTGNGSDTYALLAPTAVGPTFNHSGLVYYLDADQNGSPDNGTAITSSGPVNFGTSFNFVVCGTTSVSATAGQTGQIIVSARDTNAPTPTTLTQTDLTTIAAASLSIQKKLSSVPPPGYTPVPSGTSPNAGPLYVVLEYVNSGTVQADNVQITDLLPSGWLYVANSGRWSGSGVTALTDGPAGDPAGVSYSYTAGTTTVAATVSAVPGSTSGNLYFQVTIAPNLAVTIPANQSVTTNTATYQYTFTVAAVTTAVPLAGTLNTNSVLYSVLQTGSVVANGSSTLTGTTDAETVTVASASPGQTITWTDYIWNTGNGPDSFDISILNTPLNGSACNPANNAASPAFQCTFPAGTTFQILSTGGMTSLLDSNGNSTPDTGTIPTPSAGVCPAPYVVSTVPPLRCGYPIVISATLPPGAASGTGTPPGSGYQITVSAASFFNNTVTETVPNKLTTISANSVDLTNNLSIAAGALAAQGLGADSGSPITINPVTPAVAATTTTRFKLYVNNTGSIAQIYNLSSSFISVPAGLGLVVPPTGWTVAFKLDNSAGACTSTTGSAITSTGAVPIAPGGNLLVCAEVVVPATNAGGGGAATFAPPGAYVLQFRAELQSDATVFDTKRDQVTIQTVHSVAITPNGAQSTVPGGSVTYTHSLTNNGNVSEAITFPTAAFLTDNQVPTYTWSSTAYIDTNLNGVLDIGIDTPIVAPTTTFTLAPNGSQTVFIRVNAPAMAGSPVNTTSLTATYNTGASTASASDQTTLTDGLKLDKYQQLIGGTGLCTGGTPTATLVGSTPNASWINTPIPASPNTIPGKCIAYLIVGSNTTAANITNINLSDVVPGNTKLEIGCGVPTVTGPIAITGGPYNLIVPAPYTGPITAASTGPLPPTGVFTMQFCVKINDS